MDFNDYNDFISNFYTEILPNKHSGVRDGQAFMNYLYKIWSNEYNRITSNEYDEPDLDCFYNDDKLVNTLEHLRIVWKNRQDEI